VTNTCGGDQVRQRLVILLEWIVVSLAERYGGVFNDLDDWLIRHADWYLY